MLVVYFDTQLTLQICTGLQYILDNFVYHSYTISTSIYFMVSSKLPTGKTIHILFSTCTLDWICSVQRWDKVGLGNVYRIF